MAIATVARIEHRFTNEGRFPVALAKLDCGHFGSVELTPRRGECMTCGAGVDLAPSGTTLCACGSVGFYVRSRPNPHIEADQLTKVGAEVECKTCDAEREQAEWVRGLDTATVSHARFDPRFEPGSYHFYRRDPESPSGVFLMGSVRATPAMEAILRERRISPLSPTERDR